MTIFTAENLPSLIDGTAGMAMPRPGQPVAAAKPLATLNMMAWGSPRVVDPDKGYWVIAQDPSDLYPNDEFTTFYEVAGEVSVEDPRAEALRALLGDVKVVIATKTKPAKIVGELAESGEFETYEGPVAFEEGDILLESPDITGRMWPVGQSVFEKKYDRQV